MGDDAEPPTYLDQVRAGLDLAAAELARVKSAVDADDMVAAAGAADRLSELVERLQGTLQRERELRAMALRNAAPRMLATLRAVAAGRADGCLHTEHERVRLEVDQVIREAEGKGRAASQ
jgi:hypothetical protein